MKSFKLYFLPILISCILALVINVAIVSMNNARSITAIIRYPVLLIAFLTIFYSWKYFRYKSISIFLFIIYIIFHNLFHTYTFESFVMSTYGLLASYILFLYCFNLGREKKYKQFIVLFLIINLTNLVLCIITHWHLFIGSYSVRDISFIIVSFLPFLFFIENKILRYILVFSLGILILLTAKRSVFLGYIIFIVVFLMFYISLKSFFKNILFLLILIISCLFVYKYFSEYIDVLLNRFSQIEDSGGSGRIDIYGAIINKFSDTSFFYKCFGHGYCSTLFLIGKHAHNDFLELLYDYGFIGLILFLLFLLSNFKNIKFRNHELKDINAINSSTLILYIVLCSTNALLYSTMLTSIIFMTMGICQGISSCYNSKRYSI